MRHELQCSKKVDILKSDETSCKKKFSEWDGLVGKLLVDLVRVFWRYLEAPSSHIRQKIVFTVFVDQIYEYSLFPY